MTRSVGCAVCFTAWPLDDLAPRMHWIEDHSKVNDSLHCIHVSVLLYGWSHFSASIEASLLKQTLAALPAPPEADKTRGVKQPCRWCSLHGKVLRKVKVLA